MKRSHASQFLFVAVALTTSRAMAFSQSSPVTPIGHEWLTVQGAKAIASEFSALSASDGFTFWKFSAECIACDRYDTENHRIWSAVMGQRWVDIMGHKVGPTYPDQTKCFDAVAQLNEDVQYDHFLRKKTDNGASGRTRAISASIERIKRYFKSAVAANESLMRFSDGGATQGSYYANRSYFLFGRVAHLFQDSFSLEHAVRVPADGFKTIRDMKSYVCTAGSQQHTHQLGGGISTAFSGADYATHGDVLWESKIGSSSVGNLKPHGTAALDGMKDLWRAFMKAKKKPANTSAYLKVVLDKWMTVGAASPEHTVTSDEAAACAKIDLGKVEARRQQCLGVTGRSASDRNKPPYYWSKGMFPSIQ